VAKMPSSAQKTNISDNKCDISAVEYIYMPMQNKNSEKDRRFERLASKRVTAALHRIRLVGNLANRRVYAYSDDHVRQIFEALEVEIKQAKGRFRQELEQPIQEFSFHQ
jgi:hypothetical protein